MAGEFLYLYIHKQALSLIFYQVLYVYPRFLYEFSLRNKINSQMISGLIV
jgi:hypothetical protein